MGKKKTKRCSANITAFKKKLCCILVKVGAIHHQTTNSRTFQRSNVTTFPTSFTPSSLNQTLKVILSDPRLLPDCFCSVPMQKVPYVFYFLFFNDAIFSCPGNWSERWGGPRRTGGVCVFNTCQKVC